MALLEILKYPDPWLRKTCVPVKAINSDIRRILDDMAETMYAAPGVGLAASQVGMAQRLIVVDIGNDDETGRNAYLYKIVNPEIVQREGIIEYEEGCLSIPSIRESVKRANKIIVKGLDEHGKPLEIQAEGLLAVCFQHEVDHLNGLLFIDHLSRIKRELIKSKLNKQAVKK